MAVIRVCPLGQGELKAIREWLGVKQYTLNRVTNLAKLVEPTISSLLTSTSS